MESELPLMFRALALRGRSAVSPLTDDSLSPTLPNKVRSARTSAHAVLTRPVSSTKHKVSYIYFGWLISRQTNDAEYSAQEYSVFLDKLP